MLYTTVEKAIERVSDYCILSFDKKYEIACLLVRYPRLYVSYSVDHGNYEGIITPWFTQMDEWAKSHTEFEIYEITKKTDFRFSVDLVNCLF